MVPRISIAGLALAMAACSPPAPPPRVSAPRDAPAAAAQPAAPVISQQSPGDWTDWPLTDGNWVYRQDARGSLALYGAAGRDALVSLRCDTERRRLYLSRAHETSAPAGSITLRSSAALKTFAAQSAGGSAAYIAAEILPGDSILDAAAYSRGRIAIEASGQQGIAVPVWSELVKVIDDCRG